ncbi:hypothetical protein [Streptomyces globisporus]|uniref:hypothetical protein n=1 Tax=Streptomyces globisporus TaxID=1908 RepID=UPI0004C8E50B|nr:hypothetical protein [Streptomyces globisporus]
MSIIASIPVLKGHDGTDLTAAPEGLLLRSRHDELSVPGQAIARVRAEGGSVAVELRVPAGAAPAAHRIEGVNEAAATAFADGVNSLLPEPDEEVDGRSLVVLRTFRTRQFQRSLRRVKWSALGCLGAVVALSVIGGVAGGFVYPVAIVPIGVITGASLVAGGHALEAWSHRRRVRKHGVREFARPANVPGTYLYVDTAGMTRTVSSFGSGPYVEVAYDPEDPADVFTLKPGFVQRLDIWLGTFLFVCGLGGVAGLVAVMADALGS